MRMVDGVFVMKKLRIELLKAEHEGTSLIDKAYDSLSVAIYESALKALELTYQRAKAKGMIVTFKKVSSGNRKAYLTMRAEDEYISGEVKVLEDFFDSDSSVLRVTDSEHYRFVARVARSVSNKFKKIAKGKVRDMLAWAGIALIWRVK